jgi:hypothetical protein
LQYLILLSKTTHGHKRIQHPNVKKSSKPRTLEDTFNDLLSNIQKPLGIHHIRTILFSLPVNYLKDLRDFGLDKGGVDPFSPMTMATFSSWNSIKKAHHVEFVASRT